MEKPMVQNMKTPNSTRKTIWASSRKKEAPREEKAPDNTEKPTSVNTTGRHRLIIITTVSHIAPHSNNCSSALNNGVCIINKSIYVEIRNYNYYL